MAQIDRASNYFKLSILVGTTGLLCRQPMPMMGQCMCTTVYDTLDEDTRSMFHSTQSPPNKLQVVPSQKQEGWRDCGLVLIANIIAITFHLDSTTITFEQTTLR